ncbi:MAG: class I SAM-dependent methyltransferase [Beijerinckiaceae bacterium]|nr:class I SAM-dependent methyltransferase [Beijerinckiaceae bacterium]
MIGLVAVELGRTKRVTGCDVNPLVVKVAEQAAGRVISCCPEAEIHFFVAHAVPEAEQHQFEVMRLIDVMHHVPKPLQDEFLKSALARVKRGGRLVYKDMGVRPAWRAVANRLHDLVRAKQLIQYYPMNRAIDLASKHGFGVSKIERYTRLWYQHEIAVFEHV